MSTTSDQARAYIRLFAKYTMPGATFVRTDTRVIELATMSDDDAVFVAGELQRIEAQAAEGAVRQ